MPTALIYQHASREADRAIADHLGAHVEAITNRADDEGDDGAARAPAKAG